MSVDLATFVRVIGVRLREFIIHYGQFRQIFIQVNFLGDVTASQVRALLEVQTALKILKNS